MKERPILMSAPMALATLEDRKGETRRIIKPIPPNGLNQPVFYEGKGWRWTRVRDNSAWPGPNARETWDREDMNTPDTIVATEPAPTQAFLFDGHRLSRPEALAEFAKLLRTVSQMPFVTDDRRDPTPIDHA